MFFPHACVHLALDSVFFILSLTYFLYTHNTGQSITTMVDFFNASVYLVITTEAEIVLNLALAGCSIMGVNVRHHFDSYVTVEVVWDGMGVWLVCDCFCSR